MVHDGSSGREEGSLPRSLLQKFSLHEATLRIKNSSFFVGPLLAKADCEIYISEVQLNNQIQVAYLEHEFCEMNVQCQDMKDI